MLKYCLGNNFKSVWGCLLIITIYLSHYLILGENTYILIHDNLDYGFLVYKKIADVGMFFASSDSVIPGVGIGITRWSYPSGITLFALIFKFFPPFVAYAINAFIVHFTAFYSMRKLLALISEKPAEDEFIISFTSLCFALLPFYVAGMGSVSLIPLTFYAFIQLYKKNTHWKYLFIITLIPFYSSVALSGVFVLAAISGLFLYDCVKNKQVNKWIILGIFLQTVSYILVEYRLFLFPVLKPFVSHRQVFNLAHISAKEALELAWKTFYKGQYHASSLHTQLIFPLTLLFLACSLFFKKITLQFKSILFLVLGAFCISMFAGLSRWESFTALRESVFIFKAFNFERFYFLFPVIWTLVLFIIAKEIIRFRNGKLIVIIIFIVQIVTCFKQSDFHQNYSKHKITYREFFGVEEFKAIGNKIDRNKYFVSIGMHPAIPQFNGYSTLDLYLVNYPLSYKHHFYNYMKDELVEDETLDEYFKGWGSRAYLFSRQIGKKYLGDNGKCPISEPLDPKFDFPRLKADGVGYILSICKIRDIEPYVNFQVKNGYWKAYIYEIDDLIY